MKGARGKERKGKRGDKGERRGKERGDVRERGKERGIEERRGEERRKGIKWVISRYKRAIYKQERRNAMR